MLFENQKEPPSLSDKGKIRGESDILECLKKYCPHIYVVRAIKVAKFQQYVERHFLTLPSLYWLQWAY